MIRHFAFAAAAVSLAAGAPALAKSQSDEAAATASASDKGEKKICKRYDNSASRMKSNKLCLTKTEWKKFEREQ